MADTIYAKLKSGQWGVKGEGFKEGGIIGVLCDGEPFTETVDRIIWQGDDGQQLATVKAKVGRNLRWDAGQPRNPGTKSSRVAAKMCGKCDTPFTYEECEAKGGNWKESYCGC
jgi:hypothetical protein